MRSGFIYAIVVFIVALMAIAFSGVAIYYISSMKNGNILTTTQINAIFFTQIVLLILSLIIFFWSIFVFATMGRRREADVEVEDDGTVLETVPSTGQAATLAPTTVVVRPAMGETLQEAVDNAGIPPGTPISFQPPVGYQQPVAYQPPAPVYQQPAVVYQQPAAACAYQPRVVPPANAVVDANGIVRASPGLGAVPAPVAVQTQAVAVPGPAIVTRPTEIVAPNTGYQATGTYAQYYAPGAAPPINTVQV